MKLENILLDSNGNCKLCNFKGCYKFIKESEEYRCPTKAEEYCQPEIIEVELSIDYWSLGIVIYKMITEKFPFLTRENKYKDEIEIDQLEISNAAKELITSLLKKENTERLDYYKNKEVSIKKFLFFNDIDWNKLQKLELEPPFKPLIVNKYFDYIFN